MLTFCYKLTCFYHFHSLTLPNCSLRRSSAGNVRYRAPCLRYGRGSHRLVFGDTLRVVALYDALQCVRSLDGLLLYDFVVFDDTQSDVRRNDRESVDFLIGKILVGNLDDALLANLLAWQVVAEMVTRKCPSSPTGADFTT